VLLAPKPPAGGPQLPVKDGNGNNSAKNGNAYVGWVCSAWQRKHARVHHHLKPERRGTKRDAEALAAETVTTRSSTLVAAEENAALLQQLLELNVVVSQKDEALKAAHVAHSHLASNFMDVLGQCMMLRPSLRLLRQIATLAPSISPLSSPQTSSR